MSTVVKFNLRYWLTCVSLFFVTFFAIIALAGCNAIPTAMPKEFATAAKQLSTSTLTQADWKEILGRLNGQVIEPGIQVYAGVLYIAGTKITGASGQLTIEANGTGNSLTPEERAKIMDMTKDKPGLGDAIIRALEAKMKVVNPSPATTEVTNVPTTGETKYPAE